MSGKCDVMVATNAFGMGIDRYAIQIPPLNRPSF
jgi:superfamily II DNA helicase RecQ